MTDGPTAFQVSPVTETEMSQIKSIFERAANAIVDVSTLGQKVQELSAKVDALTREVERVREENKFLSEQLYQTRRDRDEARNDAETTKGALAVVKNDLVKANDRIAYLDHEVNSKTETIFRIERESDDNLLRAMHAEEELAKVKAKLEEAEAWFDGIRTFLHPPVETTPEPEVHEVTQEAERVTPFPTPTPTPEPVVEEEKPRDYTWPLPGYSHS